MGIVVACLLVLLLVWLRARARRKRLPSLVHDYSAQRAIYPRAPGRRQRRRFR